MPLLKCSSTEIDSSMRVVQPVKVSEEENSGHMQYSPVDSPRETEEEQLNEGVAEDLLALEFEGELDLSGDSIYSAAFVVPQIARSLNWHPALIALTGRTYMLFAFTVVIQVVMSLMIAEASQIVDVMAGKMHLCDFGKTLDKCPGHPTCLGPGGTQLRGNRLYDYETWNTRRFVKASMKVVFPDQEEKIEKLVDPGEYGLENYWCRFACCLVFVFSKVLHFRHVAQFVKILWYIPSANETWVMRKGGEPLSASSPRKSSSSSYTHRLYLSSSQFNIAGMSLSWKIWNFLVVICPKVCIWWSITWMGFRFLMETASIIDQILGAVAMDFVFGIDDILYRSLATNTSKYLLSSLTSYSRGTSTCSSCHYGRIFWFFLPRRFIMGMLLFSVLSFKYYALNCELLDSGLWVSKPMHMPLSTIYKLQNFFYSAVEANPDPYWTMPDTEHS